MISQLEEVERENETIRVDASRTPFVAVFVVPLFGILLAVAISSISKMSADPPFMTSSDSGVQEPHHRPMEVDDMMKPDSVQSSDDTTQSMDVESTDASDHGEAEDRKVEQTGTASKVDVDTDKDEHGIEQHFNPPDTPENMDIASNKDDVGNTDEQRKTDDKSDMEGDNEKENVQQNVDGQTEPDHAKRIDGISDKDDVQRNTDEPRKTDDKFSTYGVSGSVDVHKEVDEPKETDDVNMENSEKENVRRQENEPRRPCARPDMDNVGDNDKVQQNAEEAEKEEDEKEMDSNSDKDNAQETTDEQRKTDDEDKNGAGDMERKHAKDSRKAYESPDPYAFPKTLEGFGYIFNEDGELRDKDTGKPFTFQVSPDSLYNQMRYEAIGELITEYVYNLLETRAHLKRIWLPIDAAHDDARSFIFISDDALTNEDKLLILIHGSGVVRAGQWARRLIINDDLNSGTQLPYIEKAVEDGFGVMVLNTNLNAVTIDGCRMPIRENATPDRHGLYVWDNFVMKAKAAHIAIVAHSYGGVVTTNLLNARTEDFLKRVFAVAFTDSVHSAPRQQICQQFYRENAINWISGSEELDTTIEYYFRNDDAQLVAAGTTAHERTSWSSFKSVFTFFTKKYTERREQDSGTTNTLSEESMAGEKTTKTLSEESMAGEKTTKTLSEESMAGEKTTKSPSEESMAGEKTTKTLSKESMAVEKTTKSPSEESMAGEKTTKTQSEESMAVEKTKTPSEEIMTGEKTKTLSEESMAGEKTTKTLSEESMAGEKTTKTLSEEGMAVEKTKILSEESMAGEKTTKTLSEEGMAVEKTKILGEESMAGEKTKILGEESMAGEKTKTLSEESMAGEKTKTLSEESMAGEKTT